MAEAVAITGDLQVFDAFMQPIGSIFPCTALQLSWKRNTVGAATFTVPAGTLRFSSAYLREYYRVEFHSSQLPVVWVGVIISVVPLLNEAKVSCLSAETLYEARYTDYWYQAIGDAGSVAMQLHNQAVRKEALGIRVGAIDRSGAEYYFLYQLQLIGKALADLATATGGDWWVEKTGHGLRDPWLFNWADTRGLDLTGEVVLSGEVVDTPEYKRTGEKLRTFAYVIGGGISTNLWDRIKIELPDAVMMQIYGRLETVLEFKDVIDLTLLREAGIRGLAAISQPYRTLGINIDNRFGAIGTFWLADTVRLILSGVDFIGLDAAAIVQGIQWDQDAQKLGLVVDLV